MPVYVFSHCGKVRMFASIARHIAFLWLGKFRDIRRPGTNFEGTSGQRSLKPIKPVRMGFLPKPHHSLSRHTRYFACGPPGNIVAGRLQQDDEWSHISAHSLTSVFTANPWHTTAKLEWGQANRGGFRQCRSAPQTLCYGIDLTSCIERNLHWRNIIVRTQR
jgi:hypothetical protein